MRFAPGAVILDLRPAGLNAMTTVPAIIELLQAGRGPEDDGWGWLYGLFERSAPLGSKRRRMVCRYFSPSRIELANQGRIFRWLGVSRFGQYIPTGGIAIRRATGARMAPYTLAGTSVIAARDFYYRACVFETLHLPFFIALLALAIQRASMGRMDYAIQESAINLLVNAYPIMHHRNTRRRIVNLLSKRHR
jgi:hypothetical protein